MQLNTTHALKEWAVAVDALEQGKMIMLLRKGGIHEQNGRFKVAHDRTLLYLLTSINNLYSKARLCQSSKPVASGWHQKQFG